MSLNMLGGTEPTVTPLAWSPLKWLGAAWVREELSEMADLLRRLQWEDVGMELGEGGVAAAVGVVQRTVATWWEPALAEAFWW